MWTIHDLIGCLINVALFEAILNIIPGSSTFVVFLQFLFITVYDARILLRKRHIPLLVSVFLTAVFFLSSFTNTKAIDYDVPIPVHIVVKASSLVCSMLIGWIFMKKQYPTRQIIAAILVSIGLIIVTLSEKLNHGSVLTVGFSCCNSFSEVLQEASQSLTSLRWLGHDMQSQGYLFLFTSLFISSALGHLQVHVWNVYGRHPDELKYFVHLFALPLFVALDHESIIHFISQYNDSVSCADYFDGSSMLGSLRYFGKIPVIWLLVAANVLTQHLCISGVYAFQAVAGAVSLNFVLTIRKFISLVFSVWYFGNSFSNTHWLGSVLVFLGIFVYSGITDLKTWRREEEKKEKEE